MRTTLLASSLSRRIPRSVPICRPSLIRSSMARTAFQDLGISLPPGFLARLSHPAYLGWLWGFLPGPRELALLALVVVALYGRSETARRGFARLVRPWTTRPPGANGSPKSGWLGDRWFLLVALMASAAVAAWVVTWMIVVHRPPGR